MEPESKPFYLSVQNLNVSYKDNHVLEDLARTAGINIRRLGKNDQASHESVGSRLSTP
jgi:hypothetical protein